MGIKKENIDYIICRICGKSVRQINGHLCKHDMSFDEYRKKFPDAPVICEDMRETLREKSTDNHPSEETRLKMSKARKGKSFTEQHKKNMSIAFKQNYKDGTRKVSPEQIQYIKNWKNDGGEHPWTGKSGTDEIKKGHQKSVESRKESGSYEKMGKDYKRRFKSGELKVWSDGLTKETDDRLAKSSKKISKSKKSFYDNLIGDERSEHFQKRAQTRVESKIEPNKIEQKILNLNIPDLEFTGNGKHWITLKTPIKINDILIYNKNPDFVLRPFHINKAVIEAFGGHWHKKEEEIVVINRYKECGIRCLVIWEKDINNNIELIKEQILNFIKQESKYSNKRIA
jgi:hypothetical protein